MSYKAQVYMFIVQIILILSRIKQAKFDRPDLYIIYDLLVSGLD